MLRLRSTLYGKTLSSTLTLTEIRLRTWSLAIACRRTPTHGDHTHGAVCREERNRTRDRMFGNTQSEAHQTDRNRTKRTHRRPDTFEAFHAAAGPSSHRQTTHQFRFLSVSCNGRARSTFHYTSKRKQIAEIGRYSFSAIFDEHEQTTIRVLDQQNTQRIDEKPKNSTTHMEKKNEDDPQSTGWMHEKPKKQRT